MSGSFATVAVLELVLQSERVPAMEELLRELECARMSAEELRTRSVSPYAYGTNHRTTDPRYRMLSWRERAEERAAHAEELEEEFEVVRAEALRLQVWARLQFPDQPIPAALARAIAVMDGVDPGSEEDADSDAEDDPDSDAGGDPMSDE
jgi:hypothetical protein